MVAARVRADRQAAVEAGPEARRVGGGHHGPARPGRDPEGHGLSGATGKVTFTSGGKTLCVATIRSGRASCETSSRLGAGTYQVVATYPGDDAFLADRDSFSFRKARRR